VQTTPKKTLVFSCVRDEWGRPLAEVRSVEELSMDWVGLGWVGSGWVEIFQFIVGWVRSTTANVLKI